MKPPLHIFVGYDLREHLAWLVCESSLYLPEHFRRTGVNDRTVTVTPLTHRRLRREGLFAREWKIDHDGQTWDLGDGRPFSTEFSHSRFLTPLLAARRAAKTQVEGDYGWAMFVDCDFMFRHRVTDLLTGLDPTKAVYVVKHDFDRVAEGVKMDGMTQQRYHRKLWSSLILWNLDHPKVKEIDWQAETNIRSGRDLHGFCWFEDHEIGELPETWNWIPGHSESVADPAAVHWSLGGPWMKGFDTHQGFDREWSARLNSVICRMADPDAVTGDYEDLLPLL